MENLSKAISECLWHKTKNAQSAEEQKIIVYLKSELGRYIKSHCPIIDTEYFLNNHKN